MKQRIRFAADTLGDPELVTTLRHINAMSDNDPIKFTLLASVLESEAARLREQAVALQRESDVEHARQAAALLKTRKDADKLRNRMTQRTNAGTIHNARTGAKRPVTKPAPKKAASKKATTPKKSTKTKEK